MDFRIDPAEVERNITPLTKLIILTNLHNPTGAYADEATMRAVGEIAKARGARVLVDEVYLETFYGQRPPHGISSGRSFRGDQQSDQGVRLERHALRMGARRVRKLTHRMWRINDLYAATPAHPAELISVIAFDNLDKVAARAKKIAGRRIAASLTAFLDSRT